MATANAFPKEPFTIGQLWTDKRYRGIVLQVLTFMIVALVLIMMILNVRANFAALGKEFSFSFLWDLPASYDINQCFFAYDKKMPHFYAAACGALNTLAVAIVGCIAATIIGFAFGVMRLSNNWLVSSVAQSYLEFMRNVPVLLHILFWWGLIVNVMPAVRPLLNSIRESGEEPGVFFITNRGFITPKPIFEDGFGYVALVFVLAIIFAFRLAHWAKKRQEATGQQFPTFWVSLGVIIIAPYIVFLVLGSPLSFDNPQASRFNFKGGMSITPELFALTFALTIYTSAFIGEIVRSGIQAVNKGQWEASGALGLSRGQALRLIIIPQALRVIVPPLTSQYLNLTKNSSLAIAVGYMDIVATLGGITLMQTGKEMETVMLLMAFYLTISLIISLGMNIYNRAIALKER